MRAALVVLALVPLASAATLPAATPIVAAGDVEWPCLGSTGTFWMDPATATGGVVLQGANCHHSALFDGQVCDRGEFCGGPCALEEDGAAVCWYGSTTPDPILSHRYVRLGADGAFVWMTEGQVEASGKMIRAG